MKNEKGMIAVDFMFALVLVLGMSFLVFSFCFTLVITELTQYISFASARALSAAHIDGTEQINRGRSKYAQLINHPTFKPLFSNGMFRVPSADQVGLGLMGEDLYPKQDNRYLFWGTYITLQAPLLDFRIPFYGSTMGNEEGGEGFVTHVGSYLGREPTVNECKNMIKDRWSRIRMLPNPSSGAPYTQNTSASGYTPYSDNGC